MENILFINCSLKVPFWALRAALFPSSRPHRSWSVKKTVLLYLTRKALSLFSILHLGFFENDVEIPDGTYKNTKFVWIEAEREESIRGQVKLFAERANVKPLKTSAFWYFKSGTFTSGAVEPAKVGEKHGTAHPQGVYASIPKGILRRTTTLTRILAIDYHLCSSAPFEPNHPFPTALLDIIAGYRYLLELGFNSENVIVAGDSAGGNLTLALTRHIKETAVLPMPGRLLLLSLWGDISASDNGPTSSLRLNLPFDIFTNTPSILEESFAGYGIRSYLGSAFTFDTDAKINPYLSPTSPHITHTDGEYQRYPKTFIIVGSMERILDDSTTMVSYLQKDNLGPDHIIIHIANAAVHDFLLFGWAKPERTETFLRIAQWIDG
ncbi:hypothetical protein Clacol_009151 [Clathrus columnatus]|uniref:Alpha/beta hydrolase fold-3 domain-containing protein n=1 Tax=Clathrus columnatus TaxID=1419009 RepID=A0AAV5AJQ5_9AGAM|nr:hypothetical protein Clacol_009151 [Clathrus columnatus]